MKLLNIDQLPKGLKPSIRDASWGMWQKQLFEKFADLYKEKPINEAAEIAKKLCPVTISNSTWFAKVLIVAEATEHGLPASSYEEAFAALSAPKTTNASPLETNKPIGLTAPSPITLVEISEIDPSKEFTITREDFKKQNPLIVAHIKALVERYGNKQIAFRAIQHNEQYGYQYRAVGLTGKIDFNSIGIEAIYSDKSRGFYYFTDKSDGRSGYKEITFYPNIKPIEMNETVTLTKGNPNNLEILKRLGFSELSQDRFYIEIKGQKGFLRLNDVSICRSQVRKDGKIYIELFTCHKLKTICPDDESEISIKKVQDFIPTTRREYRN